MHIWTAGASPDAIEADPGPHIELLGAACASITITVVVEAGAGVSLAAVAAAESALADWNTALDTLGAALDDFQLVLLSGGQADIKITLRKGANPALGVVGQAHPAIKRDGRFHRVNIVVSDAVLGGDFSATLVGNIARHELSHALGLGHAHFSDPTLAGGFSGTLMQPVLPSEASTLSVPITACDKAAFAAAYEWYNPPTSTAFSAPTATQVTCIITEVL